MNVDWKIERSEHNANGDPQKISTYRLFNKSYKTVSCLRNTWYFKLQIQRLSQKMSQLREILNNVWW